MKFLSVAILGGLLAAAGAAFVIADGTDHAASDDCVRTHGYWKNHADQWPVDELVLGQQDYGQAELLDLLRAPPKGDASLILAHQLIAAKLNVEDGAEDRLIEGSVEDADGLLSQYEDRLPLDVRASSDDGQQMVALAQSLDGYNNGRYGDACPQTAPPSDDDEDDGSPDGNETDDGQDDDEPETHTCPKPAPNETEEASNPCPADVRVRKVTDQSEFKVAFNLSVDSLGPNKARDVVLKDSLPDLGHEWRLKGQDADDCTLEGRELVCDFGNLSAGQSRAVRVWSPFCPEECGDDLVNTAYVTASNDVNATNDQASSFVDVPECPEEDGDAAVTKSASVELGNGTSDDTVSFDIVVESLGPAMVTNVTLTDELPDFGGVYNVSGEAADDCVLAGSVLTCDLGDIAVGDARSVTLVSEGSDVGCGEDIVNTARITAANDLDASNDQASATVERDDCPPETADVAVDKQAIVTEGQDEHKDTVRFLLRVDSLGPADAHNVSLHDELPDFGNDYVLHGVDADDCTLEGFLLECDFGTVPAGENRSVEAVSYLCEIGCGDDVVNTATVHADDDADASNDEASATVERDDCPEADVGVTKSARVVDRSEEMKDTVEFTVVVSSLGTADATNVTLVDQLPELEDDHGWSLSGDAAADCTLAGSTIECAFGTLEPGANRTLIVAAYLCEIGCGGDLVNTAIVGADEDADASNNEAIAVIERDDCPPATSSSSSSTSSSSTSESESTSSSTSESQSSSSSTTSSGAP